MLVALAVAAFRDATFAVVKTFRVAMFARVPTVMLVALDVVAFRDATFADVKTFRVAMCARVPTVMLVALDVVAFRVITFAVVRFEVTATFRAPPKSEETFITKAFPVV